MFPGNAAVITAAGSSQRFNSSSSGQKKEFILLNGKSVLANAVSPFLEVPNLKAVVITYKDGALEETKKALEGLNLKSVPFFFVKGGKTRQESVFNALKELKNHPEINMEVVSIHDGARPFVSKDIIMDCIAYAKLFGGAAPAIAVADTLVHVGEDGFIDGRLNRNGAYQIQTPQVFAWPDIYEAHADAKHCDYTDDTEIFSDYGRQVAVVAGSPENRKITFSKDIPGYEEKNENTIGCTGNCSSCHGLCVKEEE